MADGQNGEAVSPRRGTGLALIITAGASFALLAYHPTGNAHTFQDMLQEEAKNQRTDAIVHGSFIVVLVMQMVCYGAFSGVLGLRRTATIAGLMLFAVGTMFLSGSMLIDGLVLPEVAAKYAALPAKIDFARSLFMFGQLLIMFLMPLGLFFQACAVSAWSITLFRIGKRGAAIAGMTLAFLTIAGVAFAQTARESHALMGAIVALGIWAIVAGGTMLGRNSPRG